MKKHTPATLAFAVSLAAATALMTQASAGDVDAMTDTRAAPEVQQAGSVTYASGGVGVGEREAMRQMQGEFPLHILFSGSAGELGVADQVRVIGRDGPLAAIDQAGPMLMLKLPPGRYTLEADFAGQTQKRQVSVGRGVQSLHWASAAVSQN